MMCGVQWRVLHDVWCTEGCMMCGVQWRVLHGVWCTVEGAA